MTVRIEVCGHLRVAVTGEPRGGDIRRQGRLALALLALEHPRAVGREELALAVWGDAAAAERAAGLSSVLSRLRRALGADVLLRHGPASVRLAPGVTVDYHEARAALAAAERALADAQPERAGASAERAVAILDAELLAGERAPWLDERRRHAGRLASRGRELVAEAALQRGGAHAQQALEHARGLVRTEPFRESAHALLMRAWAAQGDVAEALNVYEALRQRLGEELGAAPGARVRALHDELLRAGQLASPPAPAPPRGPPAGLVPALPTATARGRPGFVGRATELAALRAAFAEATAGGAPLVLLAGEAGIGKTRLALQLAQECGGRGALALYGRCDADAVVPYQPFLEALRRHLSSAPAGTWWERIPAHMGELARVLPELYEAAPARSRAGAADEAAERYRLFDAVSVLLGELARAQPVLLVLDDLHWGDTPTLLLLRQVVRSAAPSPLLVLGAYRETERGAELLDTLADLRRDFVFERIVLEGLGAGEAAALCRVGDPALPESLARELWTRSRGNPYLLQELVRQGRGTGERTPGAPPGSVPEAVKDVIARRLTRLSRELRTVLELGCVIGATFSVEVLEAPAALGEDELDRALADAVAARLIVEDADAPGHFAFEHDLTRQALYEQLTHARRARLHLRVGEALERLTGTGRGPRLAELAHHFLLAPPERGLARAAAYAEQAARAATEVLAYEEAARFYAAALEALGRLGADPERAYALWMAVGEAQVKSGDSTASHASFRRAAALARTLGSPSRLARAALGFARIAGGVVDAETVGLLEEALQAIGDADPVLRARLLARLAIELSFTSERPRLDALSAEALAVARRTGARAALAPALIARHWALWQPENVAERLEIATELLHLAEAAGDRKIELQGHRWRMMDLLELGDVDAADGEIEAYAELARGRQLPSELWYAHLFRGLRALMSGRYAEVEAELQTGLELGRRIADPNAEQGFAIQGALLARDLGRVASSEDAVRANAERYPAIPGWRALLGVVVLDAGRPEEARRHFDDACDCIPRDGLWLGAMHLLAEIAASLGDAERAAALYEQLRPYPDRAVVMGWASACVGSSSRALALLAATLGRPADAAQHFEVALSANERMQAWPLVARTRVEYGELLLAAGDEARGAELRRRGGAGARRLGMTALAARAGA